MHIIIEKDYDSMSAKAADEVMRIVEPLKDPLLCIATGDSPKGFYKKLIEKIKRDNVDISGWYFVGLDEWIGMNENDKGSCRYHLDNDLLNQLNVQENHVCFFDGRGKNLEKEIQKTEDFIKELGVIEVAVVGLGMNGHVGMNEPGIDLLLHSHVAEIAPETQKVGQKYFEKAEVLTQGITLGIANILEARHVILLVNGSKKAAIVQKVLEEEISSKLPASLLRQHPNFTVYLDEEASQFLHQSNG